MPACRTCHGSGFLDQGLDETRCLKCEPDMDKIREVIVASDPLGLSASDLDYRHQFELLALRYAELVAALQPAEWQTPLQRAHELNDNITAAVGQIKQLAAGRGR
jgi:hypothetical protein